MNYWNESIQFLARTPLNVQRLAPVYLAMDAEVRGSFYVPAPLGELARSLGVEPVELRGSVNQPLEVRPPGDMSPMVTAGYRDLLTSVRTNNKRPQVYFQYDAFKAEAQNKVTVFFCPNEERAEWVRRNWPNKKCLLMGEQAEVTAEAISSIAKERGNLRVVDSMDGESIGIVYMAFGEKAANAVRESARSLRRIGLQIPVCVVGDTPVDGYQFVEWTRESPFDPTQRSKFQFRAGRIKPWLVDLSPYERTLYLDADTEFMDDITPGFELLGEYDACIARENLTLHQLYNKKLAGWEINIQERDATIEELGAGAHVYFLNSGVLFFRKSVAAITAMHRWYDAWMEWQQWDEQLAFMRAFHRTPEARVNILEPEWNYPHRKPGIFIFHNYGRGVVRMDAPLAVGGEQLALQAGSMTVSEAAA